MKILGSKKDDKEKKPLKSKVKLYGCIALAVLAAILSFFGLFAFLYAGGWLKNYICSTVLEDSYFWDKSGCAEEEVEDGDTTEDDSDTEDDDDDDDEPVSENYWEYEWYEDDYIKFQYPKGWTVNTKNDSSPKEDIHIYGLVGVQDIVITDKDNNMLFIYLYEDLTFDTYRYYESKPYSIEYEKWGVPENDEITIDLEEKPQFHTTEKYNVSLLGILEDFSIVDGEKGKSTLLIGESANGTFISQGRLSASLDFMGYMQTPDDIIPQEPILEIDCPLKSEEDFDKCTEFVNEFFNSVEKVD